MSSNKFKAKIISYLVFQKAVSVRLTCGIDPATLKDLEGKIKKVEIEGTDLKGRVKSVRFSEGLHLLLHLPKNRYVINKLFDCMRNDDTTLTLVDDEKERLIELLGVASVKIGKSQEEILYQFTIFKGKDGKLVDGKMSVGDISDMRQKVVIAKLNRMLENIGKGVPPFKAFSQECSYLLAHES